MPKLLRPESTVAILLGASDWTASDLPKARSFLKSASAIQKLLIDSRGFGLEPRHVLNLFDSKLSANDQLANVNDDLKDIIEQSAIEGVPIEDAIVYYIGHGTLETKNSLTLLVRQSKKGMEGQTGLRMSGLAHVLKRQLSKQRYFVVLDCCFSESATHSFMGQREGAVVARAINDFSQDVPRRGGLLLCACPANETAIGDPNSVMTSFSGALVDVLKNGDDQLPQEFSFHDLKNAIRDRLLDQLGPEAPLPVLHSVNQKAGDLMLVAAFSNAAEPIENGLPDGRDFDGAAKAARDAVEREKADKIARGNAEREAAERTARERSEQEAALRVAQQKAYRDAAEGSELLKVGGKPKNSAERDSAEITIGNDSSGIRKIAESASTLVRRIQRNPVATSFVLGICVVISLSGLAYIKWAKEASSIDKIPASTTWNPSFLGYTNDQQATRKLTVLGKRDPLRYAVNRKDWMPLPSGAYFKVFEAGVEPLREGVEYTLKWRVGRNRVGDVFEEFCKDTILKNFPEEEGTLTAKLKVNSHILAVVPGPDGWPNIWNKWESELAPEESLMVDLQVWPDQNGCVPAGIE